MDRVEDQLDKMLNDLNAVNDEFVNNFFEEENPKEEIVEQEDILEEKKEEIDNIQDKTKTFSYNDILDRLDTKKQFDLNNSNDILNLIEESNSAEEFFEKIEEAENNDK